MQTQARRLCRTRIRTQTWAIRRPFNQSSSMIRPQSCGLSSIAHTHQYLETTMKGVDLDLCVQYLGVRCTRTRRNLLCRIRIRTRAIWCDGRLASDVSVIYMAWYQLLAVGHRPTFHTCFKEMNFACIIYAYVMREGKHWHLCCESGSALFPKFECTYILPYSSISFQPTWIEPTPPPRYPRLKRTYINLKSNVELLILILHHRSQRILSCYIWKRKWRVLIWVCVSNT